jgi:hypothetical protein
MRTMLLPALLLAGCATPAPSAPPTLPSVGGTLIVLDAHSDFFDDGGKLHDPTQSPIRFMGEQALQIVLRVAARSREIRWLGHASTDLEDGKASAFRVEWPLEYMEPVGRGRYELRESPQRGSIAVDATPVVSDDGRYVSAHFMVRRGFPSRQRIPGSDLDAGEPTGVWEETVEEGTRAVPLGAALVWPLRRDGDRVYLVLLRIASVAPNH